MTDGADRVEVSPEALAELEEEVAYISDGYPGVGESVRLAIMRGLATLAARAPRTDGREVTLDTGERCRWYQVSTRSKNWFVAPVRLYYQRAPGLLSVLHVRYHA